MINRIGLPTSASCNGSLWSLPKLIEDVGEGIVAEDVAKFDDLSHWSASRLVRR